MRLRARLTLATVVTALLAVVLVSGVGAVLAGRFLTAQAASDLAAIAKSTQQAERQTGIRTTNQRLDNSDLGPLIRDLGVAVFTVDLAQQDDVDRLVGVVGAEIAQRLIDGDDVATRAEVAGREVVLAGVAGRPTVVAVRDVDEIAAVSRGIGAQLLLVGLLALFGVAGLGLLVGDRLARPVRDLEDVVGGLADGDLTRRSTPALNARADELGDLARGVDAMASALDAARQEQQGFFRSAAHELRTPLTNIRGYTEGLLAGKFAGEDRTRFALEVVDDEAQRLGRLVDDVMLLARIDADDLTVDAVATDAADLVRAAADAAARVADEAGVALVVEAEACPLTTDPVRLRQVLDNLVANALRVTPSGGTVALTATTAGGGGVELTVADTGPGIAAADVAVAFDRYALWRRYRGEREVGTGLGLAIVAELVSRLGGTVHVDGSVGVDGNPGTSFTVLLPEGA